MMQHVARLQGQFAGSSLIETIADILHLPQEGRLNIRNTNDGSWGNIYHHKQQIVEVNCKNLRSDAALERIMSWQNGDYLYYALRIPDELEKKPISSLLFQSLFGTRVSAKTPSREPAVGLKKVLRAKLLEVLGPIADFLLAETAEQLGADLDKLDAEELAAFSRALLKVTPEAYQERVRVVLQEVSR